METFNVDGDDDDDGGGGCASMRKNRLQSRVGDDDDICYVCDPPGTKILEIIKRVQSFI